jgi:hypothetical protein
MRKQQSKARRCIAQACLVSAMAFKAAQKRTSRLVADGPIVLQKSKVAMALVFGENLKREGVPRLPQSKRRSLADP